MSGFDSRCPRWRQGCRFCCLPSPRRPSRRRLAEPHWSGLPIWGAEAEARGYHHSPPVRGRRHRSSRRDNRSTSRTCNWGFRGKDPVSVKNFLQIDTVDTSQQNASFKFDVLVFPFLDVYAILGYTQGSTKGLIQVPGDTRLGFIEPRVLQLDAEFSGPTYGAGFTLQGGTKVSEWRDLTLIGVADWNRTKTKLSFENESLIAHTRPMATVFSGQSGLALHRGTFDGRGGLARCDAPGDPANGRGKCRE